MSSLPRRSRYTWLAAAGGWLLLAAVPARAEYYPLDGGDLVGRAQTVTARHEDTLLDIARTHGQGYADIRLANPHLDAWAPGAGARVHIPTRYVLPEHAQPRGLVLNVPEMRLYYFLPGEGRVWTYPVGIGREGWSIPFADARVTEKKRNPTWTPPRSIREEYAAQGEILPVRVPPGPDNPLGDYAIRLSLPGYLIHGTNKPGGIGMRVSHGCVRMYPEDVEELFPLVPVGLPVAVVNQPIKAGLDSGLLYLEVHPELSEESRSHEARLMATLEHIERLVDGREYRLDWELVAGLLHAPQGVATAVGRLELQ